MDTTPQETYNITRRYLISYDDETDLSDVQLVTSYDDENTEEDNQNTLTMDHINARFKFLTDKIEMGNVKKGDKFTLIYPFEGDPDLIEKVKPSCGCTANVSIDKVRNAVVAEYSSANENVGDVIAKNINVFFKDNKSLEIKNSLGISIPNPGKAKVSLKFTGKIIK